MSTTSSHIFGAALCSLLVAGAGCGRSDDASGSGGNAGSGGGFHGSDVIFVFGNPPTLGASTIQPTPDEWTLVGAVQDYWTGFMIGGAPVSSDGPAWPKYDPDSESYMNLDVNLKVDPGWPNAEDCAFWESVLGDDL